MIFAGLGRIVASCLPLLILLQGVIMFVCLTVIVYRKVISFSPKMFVVQVAINV